MAGLTPYSKVPAPRLVPTRYGLYAAATVLDVPHGEWEYGIVWDDSNNCSQGGLWQPCCSEFEGTPSVSCRTVGVTVLVTATPQQGGGALITVAAFDDWTGPPVPVTVTVTGVGAVAIQSDGVSAEVGVAGACDDSYAVTLTIAPAAPTLPVDLVIDDTCNGTVTVSTETCVPEPNTEKAFSEQTFVYGDPFVVYDGRICPNLTEAELRASARERLSHSEQRQVEQQLWRGPTRPHFADNPDTVVLNGGTAVSPAMGIALLEGFLADHYLGIGYIHTPRYTAGLLNREYQIADDLGESPTRLTALGTKYVFGAGYPTTGPDGTVPPAGSAWAYATGQIVIRRSPIVENATRDRLTGCITGLVERTVVAGIQCGFIAGVLIDYSRCDCPAPTP